MKIRFSYIIFFLLLVFWVVNIWKLCLGLLSLPLGGWILIFSTLNYFLYWFHDFPQSLVYICFLPSLRYLSSLFHYIIFALSCCPSMQDCRKKDHLSCPISDVDSKGNHFQIKIKHFILCSGIDFSATIVDNIVPPLRLCLCPCCFRNP